MFNVRVEYEWHISVQCLSCGMHSSTDEEKQLYSDMLDKISVPITEDINIFDIDLNSLNGKEIYGRV